jgi:hypothetical protein
VHPSLLLSARRRLRATAEEVWMKAEDNSAVLVTSSALLARLARLISNFLSISTNSSRVYKTIRGMALLMMKIYPA